ncbi:hypothetical protein C6N75_23800 [Streptomyces solincola]|uniref:Uncharacterized protein n=1 Tax=Streptomyces solincola TaxID=2100817 RepID=A0A2S9PR12_9ACTN|nr:hypothetical protein [Streptomyces solincola]PRH76777.1 hypothetical protein C6N75_23800 [Streptomyces solincola]
MSAKNVCGAPGREEEEGIDVACGLEPHGPDTDHHAVIIGRYIREPIGEMSWPVAPPEPHERILRIIAETVTEATEGDGADLEDLVRRLEAEGFTLPPTAL